jgi:protocatechuate 3,4-dioxygenase beta subunit
MNNDANHSKRTLGRRQVLTWLGVTGLVAAVGHPQRSAAAASASCVVTPAQTEGPFFVDTQLNRADIRSDPADGSVREGSPLALNLAVQSVGAGGCVPLAGAIVDIWHCDALGVYSGASDYQSKTAATKFLRGYQVTDANGRVAFTTIYPGGYAGRAVHIHFKVRSKNSAGRGYEFTSQLYFDDAVTDRVHARQPYAARKRALRNSGDFAYRNGGDRLMVALAEGPRGVTASFEIGLKAA